MKIITCYKKILIWFLGFSVSIVSSILLFYSFENTLHRIDPSTVPDTPTAYFMGGFIGTFFGIIHNIIVFVVFFILILALKRDVCFCDFIIKRENSFIQKIIKLLGYGIIVLFIHNYCVKLLVYRELILSEALFYLSSVLTAVFYIIMMVAITKKQNE